MTLDYNKMFLAVTQEAVVKGHFTFLLFGSFLPDWGVFLCRFSETGK